MGGEAPSGSLFLEKKGGPAIQSLLFCCDLLDPRRDQLHPFQNGVPHGRIFLHSAQYTGEVAAISIQFVWISVELGRFFRADGGRCGTGVHSVAI